MCIGSVLSGADFLFAVDNVARVCYNVLVS